MRLSLSRGVLIAALLLASQRAFAAHPAIEAAAARASSAGVPAATVQRIVDRAAARGVPPEAVSAALAAVERAAVSGLPTHGVADKILEGIAKGIPAARLVPVVEEMAARLAESDRALVRLPVGLAARPQLVEEGAESLRRGARADALEALAHEAGPKADPGQLSLAIRELGDLAEQRAATPTAGAALGRMIHRGYAAGAVTELSDRVRDALAEGASPDELLSEIAARADAGRPMDRLVDPFADRPGAVVHDPAAARGRPFPHPAGDAKRANGVDGHPLGGPPGKSAVDRPGVPTAPGQNKRLEKSRGPGRGNAGQPPGQANGPKGNGKGNRNGR